MPVNRVHGRNQHANAKCVVLVPAQYTIEAGCEEGLHELERSGYTVWRNFGCSDISRERSVMAAAALKQGFEELMWIDSDMLFAPEDVKRLRSHRTPFVGGIYAKKAARSLACTFLKDDIDVTLGKGGGLREVLFL